MPGGRRACHCPPPRRAAPAGLAPPATGERASRPFPTPRIAQADPARGVPLRRILRMPLSTIRWSWAGRAARARCGESSGARRAHGASVRSWRSCAKPYQPDQPCSHPRSIRPKPQSILGHGKEREIGHQVLRQVRTPALPRGGCEGQRGRTDMAGDRQLCHVPAVSSTITARPVYSSGNSANS